MTNGANRTLAYEISGYRDRHWVIDCVIDDEEPAIARGRSLLQSGRYEEVRIVRQRTGPGGFTVESEVFRDTAQGDRPLTLAGDPEDAPLCGDSEDLYGIEARLAIGSLMRRYLERECITATELMHVFSYLRRFDDRAGHLMAAALHKVATIQAQKLGVPTLERVRTLNGWLDIVMSRARDFGILRRKLKFDPADLALSMRRLDATFEDTAERRFALTAQVCYQLLGVGSIAGRLEYLFEMIERAESPELLAVLRELIADGIAFPDVLGEMVAGLPSRAVILARIADVVTGRFAPGTRERIDPVLAAFVRIHAKLGLNEAAGVLTKWLVREVARGKPMDQRDLKEDEQLFRNLLPRLRDGKGVLIGGPDMQQAVGAYRLVQRQRVLRDMGMHDQANEIAKVWSAEIGERFAPLVLQP